MFSVPLEWTMRSPIHRSDLGSVRLPASRLAFSSRSFLLLGRFTTEEEIDFTLELLQKHVERLREMSPLWEMVQEGIDLKTIAWTQDSSHH
jgi:hypothetical protein